MHELRKTAENHNCRRVSEREIDSCQLSPGGEIRPHRAWVQNDFMLHVLSLRRNEYSTTPSENYLEVTCSRPILKDAILIDTPGFDANNEDNAAAKDAIRKSDIIIFVHGSGQLGEKSFRILKTIQSAGKRILFLMNCMDKLHWDPQNKKNMELIGIIESQLSSAGIDASLIRIQGQKVWPANPIFAWFATGRLEWDLHSPNKETRKDAEELIDDIQFFCKKKKWQFSPQKLETESGIPEIRRVIEEAAIMPLKELCENMEQELQALTERWTSRLRKIISDSEELLKK